MRVKTEKTRPEPRMPFASSVPPTLGEEQAASASWERRGPLGRLVKRG